jgi:hypothetical protein
VNKETIEKAKKQVEILKDYTVGVRYKAETMRDDAKKKLERNALKNTRIIAELLEIIDKQGGQPVETAPTMMEDLQSYPNTYGALDAETRAAFRVMSNYMEKYCEVKNDK